MFLSVLVSTPTTVAVPAEKCRTMAPVGRSTTAMWLFSCSVTATWLCALTLTYSGSGSSAANSAMPVSSTRRRVQSAGTALMSTMDRKPAGASGIAPPLTFSSRSFSIAMATNRPSLEMSIESGCPPSSCFATTARVAMSTTTRTPEGSTKDALVFTATRAKPPMMSTEVGSPGMSSTPVGDSSPRLPTLVNPIRSPGESV